MLTEGFTGVNIGQVNFDNRNSDCGQGIPKGNAGMGQTTGIDDNTMHAIQVRPMNSVNQFTLMVGLKKFKGKAELTAPFHQITINVIQGLSTVNPRFPDSEHIQIRTMKDEYDF